VTRDEIQLKQLATREKTEQMSRMMSEAMMRMNILATTFYDAVIIMIELQELSMH